MACKHNFNNSRLQRRQTICKKERLSLISYLSAAVIPLIIFAIIAGGFLNKVNIFDEFSEGAREGITTSVRILPSIIGLMCAVSMLKASGLIDYITIFFIAGA